MPSSRRPSKRGSWVVKPGEAKLFGKPHNFGDGVPAPHPGMLKNSPIELPKSSKKGK